MGYADDVSALVAACTIDHTQQGMRLVSNLMGLALSKTEVLVLTKNRIPTVIPVRVGDEVVESKPAVMIDSKVSFFEQNMRTVDKVRKVSEPANFVVVE